MTDTCVGCVFFVTGSCHQGSPLLSGSLGARWPACSPAEWCGDGIDKNDGHRYSAKIVQGPQGVQGIQGNVGVQGSPGNGFDSACTTYRDTRTTTDATPFIIRQIAIPLNAVYYIEVVAKMIDTTHLLAGGMDAQNWVGRGAAGVYTVGSTNVLESDNFPGTPALDIVANIGAGTADITIIGKAATTFNWSVRTLVDTG